MLRITIEKVSEVDEIADGYADPTTGHFYDSRYQIPENKRDEVWPRCVQASKATGKKILHYIPMYEQTLDCAKEIDKGVIEDVIKAFNTLS